MELDRLDVINNPEWEDIYSKLVEFFKDIDINRLNSKLLIFSGEPGSGKTYLAQQLSSILKKSNVLVDDRLVISYFNSLNNNVETANQIKNTLEEANGKLLLLSDFMLSNSDENKKLFKRLLEEIINTQLNFLPIFEIYPSQKETILDLLSDSNNSFDITILDFPEINFRDLYLKFNSLLQELDLELDPSLFKKEEANNLSFIDTLLSKLVLINNSNAGIEDLVRSILNNKLLDNSNDNYVREEDFQNIILNDINFGSDELKIKTASALYDKYLEDFRNEHYLSEFELKELKDIQMSLEFSHKLNMYSVTVVSGLPGSGRTTFIKLLDYLFYYFGLVKSPLPFVVTDEDFTTFDVDIILDNIKKCLEKENMVVLKNPNKIFTSELIRKEMYPLMYNVIFLGKGKLCFEIDEEDLDDFLNFDSRLSIAINKIISLNNISSEDLYKIFEKELEIDIDKDAKNLINRIIKNYQLDAKKYYGDITFVKELADEIYSNYLNRKGNDYSVITKVEIEDIPLDNALKTLTLEIPIIEEESEFERLEKLNLLKKLIDRQISDIYKRINIFDLNENDKLNFNIILQTDLENMSNIFSEAVNSPISKANIEDLVGDYIGETTIITQSFLEKSKETTIIIDINKLIDQPYYREVIETIAAFGREDHPETNIVLIGSKESITNLAAINYDLFTEFKYKLLEL